MFLIRSHSDENLRKINQDEALDGTGLVRRLREYNMRDLQRHLEQEELERLSFYIISRDSLWEVVTGRSFGEGNFHIDEEDLLRDLGVLRAQSPEG